MRILIFLLLASSLIIGCETKVDSTTNNRIKNLPDHFLVVLGTAQDAGFPQIGCTKDCCAAYWNGLEEKKYITSLALVDRKSNQYWLFEASPDITEQLHLLQPYLNEKNDYSPDGIFITHAHIGHYTGLLQLGKEAMGANAVPVYTRPRLDSFIRNNGPWSQLVKLNNIELRLINADSSITVNSSFKITPLRVPHRDEFSETVGFVIESSKKKILFIPDIDKWEKWERNIINEIEKVDIALLDGTFYANGELQGRDMSEVPHPFVEESMKMFAGLPDSVRSKIVFIHFNHTNPLLKKESTEKTKLKKAGYSVAEQEMVIEL